MSLPPAGWASVTTHLCQLRPIIWSLTVNAAVIQAFISLALTTATPYFMVQPTSSVIAYYQSRSHLRDWARACGHQIRSAVSYVQLRWTLAWDHPLRLTLEIAVSLSPVHGLGTVYQRLCAIQTQLIVFK